MRRNGSSFLHKSNKLSEKNNFVKCLHFTRQNNWWILALWFSLTSIKVHWMVFNRHQLKMCSHNISVSINFLFHIREPVWEDVCLWIKYPHKKQQPLIKQWRMNLRKRRVNDKHNVGIHISWQTCLKVHEISHPQTGILYKLLQAVFFFWDFHLKILICPHNPHEK